MKLETAAEIETTNGKKNGFLHMPRPLFLHNDHHHVSPFDILCKHIHRLKEKPDFNFHDPHIFAENVLRHIVGSTNGMKKEFTETKEEVTNSPKRRGRGGGRNGGFDGRTAVTGRNTINEELHIEDLWGQFELDRMKNTSQETIRMSVKDINNNAFCSSQLNGEQSGEDYGCKYYPGKTQKVRISLAHNSMQYFERVEEEEQVNVWYTKQEVDSFHSDIRTTMVALAIHNGDLSKLDPLKFTTRGLERYLDSSIDRRCRKINKEILHLQSEYLSTPHAQADRKSLKLSLAEAYTVYNQDCIRDSLSKATEDAKLAMEYFAEPVQEIAEEINDKVIKEECKRSVSPLADEEDREETKNVRNDTNMANGASFDSSICSASTASSRNTVTSATSIMAGNIPLEFEVSII